MKSIYALLILGVLGLAACELDDIPNPNAPSLDSILDNPTRSDLQALVTGTESLMRQETGFYYDVTGIIGREMYFFTGSDPRYTGELLGKGGSQLDNAGFYGTRPYAGRYATIKNANILIQAVESNADNLGLSTQALNGYLGFAGTAKAYEYLLALNLQYQNGIRFEVDDPDNLGPFLGYDEALGSIRALLDAAATQLDAAGDSFDFVLSPGFSGFDTPVTFRQFNRALAARVSLYQGNDAAALSALEASFLDLDGALDAGPARFYSTAGGDLTNPVFRVPNQADALVAHPSFMTDIAAGDDRIGKVQERNEPISLDGLSSTHDVVVFSSLSDPIPYINNEELILIYAEAHISADNAMAKNALDRIRTAHGLPAYSGPMTDDALTDEVLEQRRFSLYGQGHRWIDMRRYDRLDELPLDRPEDDVWEQMPRPVSERD